MPSKYPQPTSRCLDDGSFDPIQCFGDKCVCVNSIYGGTVGDQMYDSNKLNQMPCYNHTIHRRFSSYEHECEKIVADKLSEIYRFENEGYTVMEFSLDMCELNGWYKRVREDENSKFCAHKNGTIIGDFILPKDDPEASNMNCQCARASVLTSNPSDPPKPHRCCRNGNYPKVIRKKNGYYCLDENGNKVSKEVQEDEIVSLPCYYDGGYWRNYEEFSVYC
ncbi:hypothetical protein Bhyg_06262 [Pseudolycoriella hygida]|uniref:Thyroglobulin type-1 domain-containing protein n=1 Tax=Pseudolycoriella hygida TaxID=35572 RepID=A0A9Q0N121_9DIPT|nr:hypothetical protein Bhyg_06262 [Pseudolycoriella hygida]